MDEKHRQIHNQVIEPANLERLKKKSSADFAKYFEQTYST